MTLLKIGLDERFVFDFFSSPFVIVQPEQCCEEWSNIAGGHTSAWS
jgi:hypothetical protein